MNHIRKAFVLLFLVGASFPGVVAAQVVPGAPATDWDRQRHEYTADVLRAFNKVMEEWRAAWQTGDVEEIVALYDESALLFVGDSAPLQGRAALQMYFAQTLPLNVEIRSGLSDFVASERLAYALGPLYVVNRIEPGAQNTRQSTGTLVTILVREGKRWKIRSQIIRTHAEE